MKYFKQIRKRHPNYNTIIKNHPVVIYLTAIITGFIAAFSLMAYLHTYMGFEFEKKGTYLYYKDFYIEVNDNYIPKLYYENILLENNNLKILLEKYRTKDSDSIIAAIYKLNEDLNIKTDELIQYTTSMRVSLDGSTIPRNTNTERYRLLSEEINAIQKRIDGLYEKL
jgi:hypothetical protein